MITLDKWWWWGVVDSVIRKTETAKLRAEEQNRKNSEQGEKKQTLGSWTVS